MLLIQSTDYKLLSLCLQYYRVSWCNLTSYGYCRRWNGINVTGEQTQCILNVLPGYTYKVYVYVLTDEGQGTWAIIQKQVPPLDIIVSSAFASKTGKYGLQVYIHWHGPSVSEHVVS